MDKALQSMRDELADLRKAVESTKDRITSLEFSQKQDDGRRKTFDRAAYTIAITIVLAFLGWAWTMYESRITNSNPQRLEQKQR